MRLLLLQVLLWPQTEVGLIFNAMKRLFLGCLLLLISTLVRGQSNNPLSIYEEEQINSVRFEFYQLPTDTLVATNIRQKVENTFLIYPQTHYNSFMASYYLSRINLYPFVKEAVLNIENTSESGIDLIISVTLTSDESSMRKQNNIFRDLSSFPAIYTSDRTFITLKFAASEMAYSNDNAWFAQPVSFTTGNPLADHPVGAGYSAWLEGFANVGLYGITKIIPKINLHLYGGASYLTSFSAGNELFTNQARIYGNVEDAFVGLVGGGRTNNGHVYRYNALFGRKQFVLGDGWLIINTSMNGSNRAALQLNPRWASKNVFQAGFMWDRLFIQGFRLEANELPILNSGTVINGLNLELGNKDRMLIAASFLQIPRSRFKYYLPDGAVHTRDGLQVYNLRIFRNAPLNKDGLFFKAEGGYQRNPNFDMSAWAYYGELGWSFTQKRGTPSLSYRFAYFSGDNPDTKSYNRWDALYTGGTGEQWVQGSNMYKMVQNSNELTHRFQAIYRPMQKVQLVGQVWLFYAPQTLNLGGNPALSQLDSKYYGSEFNLTVKYFHTRNWYFHLNTAYTLPGGAISDLVPDTKNWFCLSAFVRYSF